MHQRVLLFENWKNSKKKNKRQQMITGEIPQEQIDFERDYQVIFYVKKLKNLGFKQRTLYFRKHYKVAKSRFSK